MINDYHMLSGLQKVAILFSVVGESLAMSLIKGLSKTEVRKIRSTVRSMGTVSFLVKKRVMEEFYFGFLAEQDETKEEGPIQPFEFLEGLNDEQMFALLDKEEPPVIAMILAQLEADKKMTVLNKLEPELKGQVLIELGSLDDIPLEGITALHVDWNANDLSAIDTMDLTPNSVTSCLLGLKSKFKIFTVQRRITDWSREPLTVSYTHLRAHETLR